MSIKPLRFIAGFLISSLFLIPFYLVGYTLYSPFQYLINFNKQLFKTSEELFPLLFNIFLFLFFASMTLSLLGWLIPVLATLPLFGKAYILYHAISLGVATAGIPAFLLGLVVGPLRGLSTGLQGAWHCARYCYNHDNSNIIEFIAKPLRYSMLWIGNHALSTEQDIIRQANMPELEYDKEKKRHQVEAERVVFIQKKTSYYTFLPLAEQKADNVFPLLPIIINKDEKQTERNKVVKEDEMKCDAKQISTEKLTNNYVYIILRKMESCITGRKPLLHVGDVMPEKQIEEQLKDSIKFKSSLSSSPLVSSSLSTIWSRKNKNSYEKLPPILLVKKKSIAFAKFTKG